MSITRNLVTVLATSAIACGVVGQAAAATTPTAAAAVVTPSIAPGEHDWVILLDLTGLSPYQAAQRQVLEGRRAEETGLTVVDWNYEGRGIVVRGAATALERCAQHKYVSGIEKFNPHA